jgi:phosphatidylglycerophosphatase C
MKIVRILWGMIISNLPVIAAFDFDGTLSYKDALLPFLYYVRGPMQTVYNLALELPRLVAFPLGLNSRQSVKEGLITRFLGGMPIKEANQWGKSFADTRLNQLVKPEGFQRIKWHLDQNHRCVLISAGLDLYLDPWGKQTGFNDIITSNCEVNAQGFLTGHLSGKNCWGEEKTRRLEELLGPRSNYILYAYGNSRGDQELLDSADYSYYRTLQ